MAGEIASLLLSRMTVPILYYLSRRHNPDFGSVPDRGGLGPCST